MTPITPNSFPRPTEVSAPPTEPGWLTQPKYNGVAAVLYGGQLYSRTGKMFPPRIVSRITAEFANLQAPRYVYGELWHPDKSLPEINGALNHYRNDDSPADLYFMVYECYDPELVCTGYTTRFRRIEELCGEDRVLPVTTSQASPGHYPGDAIDGLIFRRANGMFEFGRTGNVLKLKKWKEMDVAVVGTQLGEGLMNRVVGSLTCITRDGVQFNVGSGMTMDDRARWLDQRPHAIKVRYLNLNASGAPAHPTFMEELA